MTDEKASKFKNLRALEEVLNKQLSTTRSLVRLGDKRFLSIPSISTGMPTLDDELIGTGGIPRGRIIEIFGPESSGKTSLVLHIIGMEQKNGGICAYVDAEHALARSWAERLGVNVDELVLSQPDSGEDALEIVEALVDSGAVTLIIVDSVAALVPRAELAGDMGDSHMGLQARLMSQACRKLTAKCDKTGVTVVFINQLRDKIGVMFGCFNYSSRVVLADGTTEKIGKIVNQKLPLWVKSFDPETNVVLDREVVGWYDNGKTSSFLQIVTEKAGGNGISQLGVTKDHLIFTPTGPRTADSLRVGDEVLGMAQDILSPNQRQVALGSVLGDGSLSYRMLPVKILDIYEKPHTRSMHRFDIQIEGNHTYIVDNVGVHNSPETTTGGKALKFYASVRLDTRRREVIKDGDKVIGHKIHLKTVKNKVAPPLRECDIYLVYDTGFDMLQSFITYAISEGVIVQAGPWFTLPDGQKAKGEKQLKEMLKASDKLYAQVKDAIKEAREKEEPNEVS